jgi:hypothetical protein
MSPCNTLYIKSKQEKGGKVLEIVENGMEPRKKQWNAKVLSKILQEVDGI